MKNTDPKHQLVLQKNIPDQEERDEVTGHDLAMGESRSTLFLTDNFWETY